MENSNFLIVIIFHSIMVFTAALVSVKDFLRPILNTVFDFNMLV